MTNELTNEISLRTSVGGAELELFIEFLRVHEAEPHPLDSESFMLLLKFLRDCQSVLRTPERKRTSQITEAEKSMFLLALERTGSSVKSARICGRSRQRIYQIRQIDQDFKNRWDEALLIFQANLVDEARRRGQDGVVEPVYQRGELAGTRRVYSDNLLTQLLKKFCGFGNGVSSEEESAVVILPGIHSRVEEWEQSLLEVDS